MLYGKVGLRVHIGEGTVHACKEDLPSSAAADHGPLVPALDLIGSDGNTMDVICKVAQVLIGKGPW